MSSQVNGEEKTLAFGESIANDFGTIEAGTQTYAQWWLQSSLLGHFTDYSVSYNHLTSYGNEDLSLLDEVRIHELIHGFTAADVEKDGEGLQTMRNLARNVAFLIRAIAHEKETAGLPALERGVFTSFPDGK